MEVLLIARVASLSALREQWKQQPRWLLPQILRWYVASNRAPRCCFSLKSILFRLETVVPTKKIVSNAALRYSKAHRDAIKRVWPPSLDARAPVQVIFTVRFSIVQQTVFVCIVLIVLRDLWSQHEEQPESDEVGLQSSDSGSSD